MKKLIMELSLCLLLPMLLTHCRFPMTLNQRDPVIAMNKASVSSDSLKDSDTIDRLEAKTAQGNNSLRSVVQ